MLSRPRIVLTAAVAMLCAASLTACDPGLATPTPDGSGTPLPSEPSATPSPSFEPTPEPTADPSTDPPIPLGEKLLSVSALATAPNGAQWRLELTSYAPFYAASLEADAIVDYLSSVGNRSRFVTSRYAQDHNASIEVSKIVITPVSGNWPVGCGVAPELGQGSYWTVAGLPYEGIDGGEWDTILGPGVGYGVSSLEHRDRTPFLPVAWPPQFASYGFSTDRLAAPCDLDGSPGVQITECYTELSPRALESAYAAAWERMEGYPPRCGVGMLD